MQIGRIAENLGNGIFRFRACNGEVVQGALTYIHFFI